MQKRIRNGLRGRLTQEEAARLLGVSDRTFRRYLSRYKEDGEEGLLDKRLSNASHRRAPLDEVLDLEQLYESRHAGWNVKHFYSFYRRLHGGDRSYTWVKNTLQKARLVEEAKGRGKHRKKRERSPIPGMMRTSRRQHSSVDKREVLGSDRDHGRCDE